MTTNRSLLNCWITIALVGACLTLSGHSASAASVQDPDEDVRAILAEAQRLGVERRWTTAREMSERALQFVVATAPRTQLHADVLKVCASTWGDFQTSIDLLEEALAIERAINAAPQTLSATLSSLAVSQHLFSIGGREETSYAAVAAIRNAREAVALMEASEGERSPSLVASLSTLHSILLFNSPLEAEAVAQRVSEMIPADMTVAPEIKPLFDQINVLRASGRPEDQVMSLALWGPVIAALRQQDPDSKVSGLVMLEAAREFGIAGRPQEELYWSIEAAEVLDRAFRARFEAEGRLTDQDRSDLSGALFEFADRVGPVSDRRVVEPLFRLVQLAQSDDTSAAVAQASRRRDASPATLVAVANEREQARIAAGLESAMLLAVRDGEVESIGDRLLEVREARKNLEQAREQLRQLDPPLSRLGERPISLEELAGREAVEPALSDGEALLVFFQGGLGRRGISFLVTRSGVTATATDASVSSEAWEFSADTGRMAFAYARFPWDGPGFNYELANTLYRKLLAPLEPKLAGITRLTIVPQGELRGVPFSLLISSKPHEGASQDDLPRLARWLIDDFTVAVSPSVSAFYVLRSRPRTTERDGGVLTVSNPLVGAMVVSEDAMTLRSVSQMGADDALENVCAMRRLPMTTQMELALINHFGTAATQVLTGSNSTEKRFRDLATSAALARFDVIAFNTHALTAAETRSLGITQPAIVMTPPWPCDVPGPRPAGVDPFDDGLLTASEIAGLNINARLVLLTACNTAAGSDPDALPLTGLVSAFFAAGAQSVVASHWEAEEIGTSALLDAMFDENLPFDLDIASRLRTAQLALKGSVDFSHPAYWGVFSVFGDSN